MTNRPTEEEIKEELMQMECIKMLTSEDVYYILNESGIVQYIYDSLNLTDELQ